MTKQSFVLRSLIFAKQLIALRRHCSRPTSRRTISSLSTERYPAFICNDERNYERRYTDFAAVICLFSNKKKTVLFFINFRCWSDVSQLCQRWEFFCYTRKSMQVGDNYTSCYSKRNLLCVFSLYEAFTIDTLSQSQSLLHTNFFSA